MTDVLIFLALLTVVVMVWRVRVAVRRLNWILREEPPPLPDDKP